MCLLCLLFERNSTVPSWFFFNCSCSFLVFCTRAKLIFLKRKSECHPLLKIFPKLFFGIKTKSHNCLQGPASLAPHNCPVAFSTSEISHSSWKLRVPSHCGTFIAVLSGAYSCSMFSPPC